MKITPLLLILTFLYQVCCAQENKPKIYNPDANAFEELAEAVQKAKQENKNVFIQIGGNWCPWCIKFHNFVKKDAELDSILNTNYIVLKINYSREKPNYEIMQQLDFPQRFGFPVFVILNDKGERIHTQNSALLEKDKSYDKEKIKAFFLHWTVKALSPDSYKKR